MFYFYVSCPDNYSISPPRVKLMTGLGRCRFNPNLYSNGKVCLSILNTWAGPSWSPANSIATVLMSIQSLLTEKPYHNEPGFEIERHPGHVKAFNDVVQHETIRFAVLEMMQGLEEDRLPRAFGPAMDDILTAMFEGYVDICQEGIALDGQPFQDPFGWNRGHFQFGRLLEQLHTIKLQVDKRVAKR